MSREEMWGHEVDIPEPEVVGDCAVCTNDLQSCEASACDSCGRRCHEECMVKIGREDFCPVCAEHINDN